jgi:diguanylate cyclase (GGDEF)-like protein
MNKEHEFRIMVIDDNPSIHNDFIKILSTTPKSTLDYLERDLFNGNDEVDEEISLPRFKIDIASQGQEGVAKIQKALEEGNPYALAFVDIRMPPGWDGVETIKHIWELDKDIQIVICTAYSDYSWEETVSQLGKTDNLLVLKKPFDIVAVRQLACALTRKWQLLKESRQYTNKLKHEVEDRTLSLQKSLSLVTATLESSSDGILVIDNAGEIINYNHKFEIMWDIPKDIAESKDKKRIFNCLREKILNLDELNKIESYIAMEDNVTIDTIHLKNEKIIECYSQPQILYRESIGRVFNFRDITKRAMLEKKLQHQATHDALTGLPNRILLLERLRQMISEAEKNDSQFALLFLDLDRFKLVNDSLSHAVGDELLIAAAQRLQSVVRADDVLARIGGDEFVILMPNVNKIENVFSNANKLLKIFQQPFHASNRNITITASIGISIYPKDGLTGDLLLRNADSAMYHAKEAGRNNFQKYAAEMGKQNLEKLDNEMQIRQALENKEFFLVYQPQLHLIDKKIVAVEALIRWNHPQKGILLPIDFIPIAEESGLTSEIGEWVLRTACEQNRKWQDAGLPPVRVAINVTAQQFRHQNLVHLVSRILKETKLNPKYLELELTENVIVSNPDIIRIVNELKKLGICIALDDFGTGYSSLSFLKKIPLDRLKIDGSFIQNIKNEQDDEAIVRAIIAMAKSLNLEVLAEGVETQIQSKFLSKELCGEVQGYYFSKPLTNKELEEYLKDPDGSKLFSKTIDSKNTS